MSLEWPADLLIMDESSGRAMARNLNIRITGTLGVLLKAKRDGQIPSLESEMDRLVQGKQLPLTAHHMLIREQLPQLRKSSVNSWKSGPYRRSCSAGGVASLAPG